MSETIHLQFRQRPGERVCGSPKPLQVHEASSSSSIIENDIFFKSCNQDFVQTVPDFALSLTGEGE